jgi:sec-independent protein translocase protein TatB
MSGIGSSEFILLLVIGLIVLGPKRLPEIANKIGGWIGQARRMTRVLKRQLEDELSLDANRTIHPPPAAAPRPTPPPPAPPAPPADDEAAAATHVPSDDDTYSPLHDDAGDDDETGPKKEREA